MGKITWFKKLLSSKPVLLRAYVIVLYSFSTNHMRCGVKTNKKTIIGIKYLKLNFFIFFKFKIKKIAIPINK